ncbi:MAG: PEGA domain-containing protein, partial [Deltaproteobacteria bacterium]|nr:PEGA domain-containing protein [Deltaproteobacteria bacterium]
MSRRERRNQARIQDDPRKARARLPLPGSAMSSCTLLVLLLLAARPAAADIVPDQGGRLLFLGIHPEGDGVPWELAGAVEQAVLQELSRNGPSTVLSAVGAGPGEGRPSRPGEVLHQAEKQLEKGLSCFRAAQLEEASELLVAAFAAFLEQLPYLSDPLLLARAGLHLALVQQAAGRLDEAEQIVDQLVQLGLGRELPEEELPSSLRTILARSRRRLTVQPGVMVQLATRPAGALIFLDGHYQGRTPWRGVQPPGRHWLRLEKPGFLPQYHSIELEAGPGKLRKIDVDLRRG